MNTPQPTGGPAFPSMRNKPDFDHEEGMTLREYAAIKLKVPNSGTEWLDEMISKSLRDDFALDALQGLLADSSVVAPIEDFAGRGYEMADAMLRAREAP